MPAPRPLPPFPSRACRTVRALAAACVVAATFALVPATAGAAVVAGLYEGTVPGVATEAGRAALADAALRQVVVRVTGRGTAASDPLLAPLYATALRYVQTIRAVAGGQVTVGFDGAALESALVRAGQPLWSADRPLTLAVVVVDRAGQPPALAETVDADEWRAVEREAVLRGLPLAWPGALDATGAQQLVDDALAGRGDALLEFARRYDATGVLYGRVSPGGATRWNWLLPIGSGGVSGSVTDGVDAVAERYAQALTSGQTGTIALLPVVVAGAHGLAGLAAAQSALDAVPNVRGVQLERAAADVLTFRVNFRGDLDTLRRAIASTGRLQPQEGGPGEFRFVLQP